MAALLLLACLACLPLRITAPHLLVRRVVRSLPRTSLIKVLVPAPCLPLPVTTSSFATHRRVARASKRLGTPSEMFFIFLRFGFVDWLLDVAAARCLFDSAAPLLRLLDVGIGMDIDKP